MFKSNSDVEHNLSNYLKISILIIASSFLAYSVYWAAYSVFWIYNITIDITSWFKILNIYSNLQQNIIIIQEYAASAGYFMAIIGAIFAFQCAILLIKNNQKYLDRLGKTLLFNSLFFLMLLPSSIHHLLGSFLSWTTVNIYVGLSFLLQVLLIAPASIILSHKLRKLQCEISILKWITISAPLAVLGFWIKYLLFWIATLYPLGPKQANLATIIGGVNSFVTLLIAGILTLVACITLYRKRRVNINLIGIALILFGSHFIIYDLVSIWVPVYKSFLYLTDFWMIVLPILGLVLLKMKSFNVNT
jgi:hypothetical protein